MFDLNKLPDGHAVTREGLIVPESCIIPTVFIETRDRKGKILFRYEAPARSFVKNFRKMIMEPFLTAPSAAVSYDSLDASTPTLSWANAAGSVVPGGAAADQTHIGFGTGTTAPDVDDVDLETVFARLVASKVVSEQEDRTIVTISAAGTNTSGNQVNLSEITLQIRGNTPATSAIIMRDTQTPVPVPNGITFSGGYTFTLNV